MITYDKVKKFKSRIAGEVSELCGIVNQNGDEYRKIILSTARSSGYVDKVPVYIPVYNLMKINVGDKLYMFGDMYSYSEGKGLKVYVYFVPNEFCEYYEDKNDICFEGYLARKPILRQTPLGKTICDGVLAINKGAYASYIPCIFWGDNAIILCNDVLVGDKVFVFGRFQSRIYEKEIDGKIEERTAYEVSVSRLFIEKDV